MVNDSKENGYLVISLDFELLWGVFDKVNYKNKIDYFYNTRLVIPEILKLFENFHISCTWATVGMLFNENWKEWENNKPKILPSYLNSKLSPYNYGEMIRSKETERLCFAPDLIEKIKNTELQEIGTHTYSHYYCLEVGQNLESFKTDLHKAISLGKSFGIDLKSIVFPRNQINQDYLKDCFEYGIETFRTNPKSWYWQNIAKNNLTQRIFRTGDAYFGGHNKIYSYEAIEKQNIEPISQKASRLLRPYSSNYFLNLLKINRIKKEMSYAAENKKIYHLWWHPHNFGSYPEENLKGLKEILNHYNKLKSEFNFKSLSMGGLKDSFLER